MALAISNPVQVHSIVGNAPYITSVQATAAPSTPRTFYGTGAPASGTLTPGNGMYNAAQSGFLINASIVSSGAGYSLGDVLSISGGTGTAMEIEVDMVGSSGEILDFHIVTVGNYSAYPTSPAASTGAGSGATFNLNQPPPDYYLDLTTPTAPVLYVCTASGSNSSSVWAKISGGGGNAGIQQFKIVSDGGDYWVCVTWDGTTAGTTNVFVIKQYKVRCGTNAIASETIRTVTYSYTYTPVTVGSVTGYYTRAVSGTDGTTETDFMNPDPLANDIIYASPCTTNILSGVPNTVASVSLVNSGTGGTYAIADVLTLAGGTGTKATIKVLTVSAGKIATFQLLTSGSYSAPPTLTNNAVTGGSGSGATFNVTMSGQLIDLTDRTWASSPI